MSRYRKHEEFLFLAVCVFVSGFTYTHGGADDTLNTCSHVREEFTRQNLGAAELVPEIPQTDELLSVCSRTLKHSSQKSCCTYESEKKYVLRAEKFLKDNIHTKNLKLKSLIENHITDFEKRIISMIEVGQNNTGNKLSDWYSIPVSEHRLAVNHLFTDLEEYMKKTVILPSSVAKFFDNIFPVIVKNSIFDKDSSSSLTHVHHCLSKHRQDIQPKPFGDFPAKIVENLNSALSISRAYLDALHIVLEAINTTDFLVLEDDCKHALTRLQYCSHCQGLMQYKPCKGFCTQVMRGCLSILAEIGPEWDDIIGSIEILVRGMGGVNSIDKILQRLPNMISDAIMHAMVNAPKFFHSMQKMCKIPASSALAGGQGKVPHNVPDTSRFLSINEASWSENMYVEVMRFTLDLVDYKGLYKNMADEICTQPIQFEQDQMSGQCWNGTSIAGYQMTLSDPSLVSQAQNNQEVKVSLILDPKMRRLKDKLSSVNLNLQSHTDVEPQSLNVMVSDDAVVYSGDKKINLGKGTTLEDDEDLYNSGSGSGDAKQEEPDVVISSKDTFPERERPPPYEKDRDNYIPPPPNQNKQNKPDNGSRTNQVSLPLILGAFLVFLRLAR
ncbi:hypothetical protein ACJMK2_018502 [Sinanodonta woodiana]|uniref:Uncharacterized protein n=1 Tax=Sinanodonta woodiana TaxID=1069815 RepID=A0ABD3UDL7_SINWO